jgi:hypothetical protein
MRYSICTANVLPFEVHALNRMIFGHSSLGWTAAWCCWAASCAVLVCWPRDCIKLERLFLLFIVVVFCVRQLPRYGPSAPRQKSLGPASCIEPDPNRPKSQTQNPQDMR